MTSPPFRSPYPTHSHSRSLSGNPTSSTVPSWTSFKKPLLIRGQSHKRDPFLSIRLAFADVLPPGWRSDQDLHLLAKDYVAVAVGMFTAYVVEQCPLDRLGGELLALRLDEIGATRNVTFLMDTASNRLIIANSKILAARIACFPNQEELSFITYGGGKYHRIPGQTLTFLSTLLTTINHSLANRLSHTIQIGDAGSTQQRLTESQMHIFCEWMTGSPVVFVSGVDAGIGKNIEINELREWERLKRKERHTVRISLEGINAGHDHYFDLEIPKSLFHLDSLAEPMGETLENAVEETMPFERPLSLTSQAHFTFRTLQDRLQSIMFDRLNDSDAASNIWSDVSVMIES